MRTRRILIAFTLISLAGCSTFVPENQKRAQRNKEYARARAQRSGYIIIETRPNPYAKYSRHRR